MTTVNTHVVILGALSAMAEATARLYAAEGAALTLVGRTESRLAMIAADLTARGAARVRTIALDLADEAQARPTMEKIAGENGGIDIVGLFYGIQGDQDLAERDPAEASRLMLTNYVSAAQWCLASAALLEKQAHGSLVVIGSVAGDRGRRSNYVYGSTKAGLATLVEGLAHRLAASGARAVLIKPGFVISPMTAGRKRGGPLWAKPEKIAEVFKHGARRGGPVVYAPWFWRHIMTIICAVPAPLFHRTRL